jgi:hypothetical protein
MKTHHFLIGVLACCWACNNIEDVAPSERNTFIQFYEKARNLEGISAEVTADGFVILANEVDESNINGIFIYADRNGNETATERLILPRFSPKALKVTEDGYYVTGDRIKFNPTSENLFDLTVTSAMLYHIGLNGDTTSMLRADTAKVAKTDFHGSSVTVNGNGEVILLGTFKQARAQAFERPFIAALNPSTLDTLWTKRYDVLERDYINTKSVHVTSTGNIIWASALLREAGDLSRTYLTIPYVKEKSVFINNDHYGENSDQELFANDIQPAEAPEFGYGVIGTYALPTGNESNMFFIRVDHSGNFIPGSERFFDGELSAGNTAVTQGQSASDDTGDAITSTSDGGFILAGSMLTTTQRGNGGLDLFIVKVDAQGNILWNKIIGGEGDETVSSVREAGDGGLVICGSNNLSGLSSIFLIKTDKNGNLND